MYLHCCHFEFVWWGVLLVIPPLPLLYSLLYGPAVAAVPLNAFPPLIYWSRWNCGTLYFCFGPLVMHKQRIVCQPLDEIHIVSMSWKKHKRKSKLILPAVFILMLIMIVCGVWFTFLSTHIHYRLDLLWCKHTSEFTSLHMKITIKWETGKWE